MHHQHSQASLCKLLFRRSFNGSPKLFSLNSLITSQSQCVSDSAPLPKPKTPELLLHKPTINSPHFLHPTFSNSPTQFINRHNLREFSGGADGFDQNKEVDMINLKFAEAREEIEMAMESKETVYLAQNRTDGLRNRCRRARFGASHRRAPLQNCVRRPSHEQFQVQ
ncbi:unnamed protein product [Prunus armeniaca]